MAAVPSGQTDADAALVAANARIEKLLAENTALRKVVRNHSIVHRWWVSGFECELCGGVFASGNPSENHEPGCLAAPLSEI